MQIRWKVVLVLIALVFGVTAFLARKTATAAPQSTAPAKAAMASAASTDTSLSIPDTTIAVNSSAPKNCQRFGVFQKALCATGVVRRSVLPT